MSTATRWRADQSAHGDRNQIVRAVQDERRHANRRQDAGDVDLDVELVYRVDAKFRFRAPSSGYQRGQPVGRLMGQVLCAQACGCAPVRPVLSGEAADCAFGVCVIGRRLPIAGHGELLARPELELAAVRL
jgi:hypothetical protein